MKAKQIYTNVDFNKNQALNFKLELVSKVPTAASASDKGRAVYCTINNTIYFSNGSFWYPILGVEDIYEIANKSIQFTNPYINSYLKEGVLHLEKIDGEDHYEIAPIVSNFNTGWMTPIQNKVLALLAENNLSYYEAFDLTSLQADLPIYGDIIWDKDLEVYKIDGSINIRVQSDIVTLYLNILKGEGASIEVGDTIYNTTKEMEILINSPVDEITIRTFSPIWVNYIIVYGISTVEVPTKLSQLENDINNITGKIDIQEETLILSNK